MLEGENDASFKWDGLGNVMVKERCAIMPPMNMVTRTLFIYLALHWVTFTSAVVL